MPELPEHLKCVVEQGWFGRWHVYGPRSLKGRPWYGTFPTRWAAQQYAARENWTTAVEWAAVNKVRCDVNGTSHYPPFKDGLPVVGPKPREDKT